MKRLLLSIALLCNFICVSQNQPTPEFIRTMIAEDIKALSIEPEKIFKIENQTVDGVPIRIYRPLSEKSLPIIYNIHGGALVAGGLDTHENISRKLANASKSIVISIDYKKPPESPFPHGVNDVVAVYDWIVLHQQQIAGNKNPVSLTSDSGGCLLAAALQIEIAKAKKPKIAKSVYINPAFDLRNPSDPVYKLVVNWYLGKADANQELASPILATDFSVFAPSLIVVNERDQLMPHGVDFAKKLSDAKVKSELFTVKDEDHFGGFWAAAHPKVNAAFEKAIAFLK